jgi:hypothetical protein
LPIYRDDAASLESYDRLRFSRLSDLDPVDNHGIDAGQAKGQHGAVLQDGVRAGSPRPALQDNGNMVLEQDEVDEGPHRGMAGGQTCLLRATDSASNTGETGQNGQSSSIAAHETASESQKARNWRVKLGALRAAMVQGEGGSGCKSLQVTRPLVQGIRWIGERCLCADKDGDGTNEEAIRQGIRLVHV